MLQVVSVLFGCFMCFTYMLQVHVPNVSSVLILMLHSCCKCFALFARGKSSADRVHGARGAGGLGCCGRGALGACSSSPLIRTPGCRPCGPASVESGHGVHSWSGANVDGGGPRFAIQMSFITMKLSFHYFLLPPFQIMSF
jgi:hypothetical protein